VDREDLRRWIDGYVRAWRTPGTDGLASVFTPDATYLAAPFDPPVRGLEAIARFWEAERESAEEVFTFDWEPVAVDGSVGVARVDVRYGNPVARTYRDLWIVTLADDGRCSGFEEWPFHPDQPRVTAGL
jgi:uncharacterized protein (TIGR02246 family)